MIIWSEYLLQDRYDVYSYDRNKCQRVVVIYYWYWTVMMTLGFIEYYLHVLIGGFNKSMTPIWSQTTYQRFE